MNLKRLKFSASAHRIGHPEMDFIADKGMMCDFLLAKHESDDFVVPSPLDRVDDVDKSTTIRGTFKEHAYEHFVRNGGNYYLETTSEMYRLFKEFPLVIDDDTFVWKKNTKYNSLEAKIKDSMFEYQCIINSDGNGKVVIRYTKCENKHRNNVSLAEIDIENAYNEAFLNVIQEWKKNLKESIPVGTHIRRAG